jgi:hypothetical protein
MGDKQKLNLIYYSILKLKATCSSKTSLDFQRTTRRYTPEDRNLHNNRCENLISNIDIHVPDIKIGSIHKSVTKRFWRMKAKS